MPVRGAVGMGLLLKVRKEGPVAVAVRQSARSEEPLAPWLPVVPAGGLEAASEERALVPA